MKKIILFAICIIGLSLNSTFAQSFKAGIKVGINTPHIRPADAKAFNTDSLNVRVSNAYTGFHVGGWARVGIGRIFIQPEVLFNSSKTQYTLKNLKGAALLDSLRNERLTNIDIPVMIGWRMGNFRMNAGPVAHIHLGENSDLTKFASYKAQFNTATWGYQAGVGLEFGRLGIDLRYEGNFSKFGEHISFGGKSYDFDKSPKRFLVSASIGF